MVSVSQEVLARPLGYSTRSARSLPLARTSTPSTGSSVLASAHAHRQDIGFVPRISTSTSRPASRASGREAIAAAARAEPVLLPPSLTSPTGAGLHCHIEVRSHCHFGRLGTLCYFKAGPIV